MRFSLSAAIFIATINCLYGQASVSPEFGKADLSWWSNELTAADTSIDAIILYDYAKCVPDRYSTKVTSRRRIKILKKTALAEWGNISIVSASFQRISDFDCTVYNQVNGQVVTNVVEKKDLMKDKIVKGVKRSTLAIPGVKEGSVIEYNYTIVTTDFGIPDWKAQESIPVKWSEYEVAFGFITSATATIYGNYRLSEIDDSKKGTRRYIFKDLPAFEPEPDMLFKEYYKASIHIGRSYSKGFNEVYKLEQIAKHGLVRDSSKMDTKSTSQTNLKISESKQLTGKTIIRKSGYDAIRARRAIKTIGIDEYLNDQLDESHWTISKKELTNVEDSTKDLILNAEMIIEDQIQETDSLIYLNPSVFLRNEKNPYKLEKRKYPLDLGSRAVNSTTTVILIPEGYQVDELPRNISLELPEKTVTFLLNASVIGNSVYITTIFKNAKIIFAPAEYPALREFYARMIAKKSEVVVFKKRR